MSPPSGQDGGFDADIFRRAAAAVLGLRYPFLDHPYRSPLIRITRSRDNAPPTRPGFTPPAGARYSCDSVVIICAFARYLVIPAGSFVNGAHQLRSLYRNFALQEICFATSYRQLAVRAS